jgi:hypothetical protein
MGEWLRAVVKSNFWPKNREQLEEDGDNQEMERKCNGI